MVAIYTKTINIRKLGYNQNTTTLVIIFDIIAIYTKIISYTEKSSVCICSL